MRKPWLLWPTTLGMACILGLILVGVLIEIGILVWTGFILVDASLVDMSFVHADSSVVGKIKDVAGTAQSAATVIAFIVGGGYVLFKLDAFRDLKPHVNVVHEVSYQLAVTAP